MTMTSQAPPSRSQRRAAYRQIRKAVPGTQWSAFTATESRVWPRLLYWQHAPWDVFAHVYTHCKTLAREWAGQLTHYPKFTTMERARIATKGICATCYYQWRTGERLA